MEAMTFNKQYQNYSEINTVSDRLRWCRHHLGLTQQEVAKFLHIDTSLLHAWETGQKQISFHSWESILRIFRLNSKNEAAYIIARDDICRFLS